jgi:RNA polymerase primary sigma factor
MENWLSVAAIEAELKPKEIESFDTVAGTYKKLRALRDQFKNRSLSPGCVRREPLGNSKALYNLQRR